MTSAAEHAPRDDGWRWLALGMFVGLLLAVNVARCG